MLAAVASWFSTDLEDPRTDVQLQREQYIFYIPQTGRYSRFMAIVPVFVAQACLGSFYSTSIFNKSMDSHVWGYPGANAGMFTTCVAFYGLGTIVFGTWVGRYGAFYSVRRSLFLTPLGWACASIASRTGQLWLLYAGYGVLHGLGCAHAYISTTAVLQQWFPTYKGFMSGFAVCGAGVGSYIWTSVGRLLMDTKGPYRFEPYQVQAVYAVTFAVLIGAALPFLRNPPPGWSPPDEDEGSIDGSGTWRDRMLLSMRGGKGRGKKEGEEVARYSTSPDQEYTFLQAASTGDFRLTALLIFGSSIAGVVFLSSAADMTQNIFGYDASYAALVTSWLNLVNFTGRFMWGFVTDRIGRKAFWLLSTATQSAALIAMGPAIASHSFSTWLACFLLIGSLYGGGFGVLPAFLSDMYGPKISAATHGMMIGVWAAACIVGIPIFTYVTATHSTVPAGTSMRVPTPQAYILNSQWLAALPAAAFLVTLLLNVRREDRIASRVEGEAARVRCGPYVMAISIDCLGPAKQQEQYACHREGPSHVEEKRGRGECETVAKTDTQRVEDASVW